MFKIFYDRQRAWAVLIILCYDHVFARMLLLQL